jgi:hypothetical protein
MRPGGHILAGGVASIFLYPFPSIQGLIFWFSSFAVDFDHYLEFIYHNGFTDFSIKKGVLYHDVLKGFWKRPEFLNLSIFHTVEFAAMLYILSLWTDAAWLRALFLGLVFHVVIDILYLYREKILTLRAYSLIEYWIRKKRLLGRGLSPGALCAEALRRVNEADGK